MIIVGKIISFEYKHALLCGQDNKGVGGRGQQKQKEADGARKRNRERPNKRPFFRDERNGGRKEWAGNVSHHLFYLKRVDAFGASNVADATRART